jgi:hypothetical protein
MEMSLFNERKIYISIPPKSPNLTNVPLCSNTPHNTHDLQAREHTKSTGRFIRIFDNGAVSPKTKCIG